MLTLVLVGGCSAQVQSNVRAQSLSHTPPATVANDSDRDRDGVPNARDLCPNAAEDIDHVADTDGCPEVDQDCDGIADAQDVCAELAEDRDNYQDADGCPDPDNDEDRLVDACDRCPNEPEVYNGIDDEDGCPDRSGVRIEMAQIRIVSYPLFARNHAGIQRSSIPVLEAVVQTLQANPQLLEIAVIGHASARERHPDTLAAARAHAVKAWLEQHGINTLRLVERAYGATRPLVPPSAGRAQQDRNQRVEFLLIRTQHEGELQRWDGHQYVAVERPPERPVPVQSAMTPVTGCAPAEPAAMRPGGCALATTSITNER